MKGLILFYLFSFSENRYCSLKIKYQHIRYIPSAVQNGQATWANFYTELQDSDIERQIQWRRWQADGIMILPSSQKSSVIKPSQPKMAAVGDPHGGEIPMELNAIAVWCVPCRRALRINSDNRIVWNLELSKTIDVIPTAEN